MSTNIKLFHVRYQERIEIIKGRYIMVTDALIPLDEFVLTFMTPETVENLLSNTSGIDSTDKGWEDNGICSVTGAYLEHRVVGVICPSNFDFTMKNLHKCLDDKELIEQYTTQKMCCASQKNSL